jgi:hypothetical protein
MKDEALKLALEALEKSDGFLYNWHENATDDEADAYATARQLNEKAITAIKQALAADVREPVATLFGSLPVYETPPVKAPVAWLVYAKGSRKYFTLTFDPNKVPEIYIGGEAVPLYTTLPAAQPAPNCTRSHPHESMDAMCELRTKIARLTNESARLKAQPAPMQEPVIFYRCNGCGHAYEEIPPTSCDCMDGGGFNRVDYYTTQPAAQRPWVGLTDEEKQEWVELMPDEPKPRHIMNLINVIEAQLKEKNT